MIIINHLLFGYLDRLFISLYFNPNQFLAIPVDENNYIKTKTTCFLFLVFQYLLESRDISNEQYYSLYHRIFNQDSTIYDCLSKVNIDEIKDILEIKSIPNLYYSEKKVAKLFNISGYKTHEILKYIYPSFKGLYYFKPKYIFENYFIIYLFINYAPTIKITNDYNQILFNCLLGIVLFCVMFWIIVIIILVYIEKKLSKDVTLPIIKLRQSIETMNLNDFQNKSVISGILDVDFNDIENGIILFNSDYDYDMDFYLEDKKVSLEKDFDNNWRLNYSFITTGKYAFWMVFNDIVTDMEGFFATGPNIYSLDFSLFDSTNLTNMSNENVGRMNEMTNRLDTINEAATKMKECL